MNPEKIIIYNKLHLILKSLNDMINNVKQLTNDIEYVYIEVNDLYNRLESIEPKPKPRPATVEDTYGVFRQQKNESREHFIKRINNRNYDETI